jgi:hypothetical protein
VTKTSWSNSLGTFTFSEVLNQLTSFSGAGPRRDGVMKPDLTAPGSAIASALSTAWQSLGAGGTYVPQLLADDGKHVVLQGTSMAAPHVTGAVAMMLQLDPGLTPSLVHDRLAANTRRDAAVTAAGAVPNKKFGWGKLDLTNVLPAMDTIAPTAALTRPNGGETFIIGSEDTIRWNAADNVGVATVDLDYSVDNGTNWTPIVQGLKNTGRYMWVVPNQPVATAKVRVTARDIQSNTVSDPSNAAFTISPGNPLDAPPSTLAFAVHAPAPSPFSGRTTVGFDLPAVSLAGKTKWPTTVRIFNVAGRLVRTAIAADLLPGPHTALWDGRDADGFVQPAGVYFIEVATPSKRATVRAVFLR